ncbi:unnamed protein product [Linum trigynum]|uniref:Uncharacterized protein n=1 Tax=Linum trigynum TaxID=586398 RepID=A0AAV2ERN1_9ROSI
MVVDPRQLEKWALETDIRALLGLDRDDSKYGVQQSGPPAREAQCYLLLLLGSTLIVDKMLDLRPLSYLEA